MDADLNKINEDDAYREYKFGDGGCFVGMTLAVHNTGQVWHKNKKIFDKDGRKGYWWLLGQGINWD